MSSPAGSIDLTEVQPGDTLQRLEFLAEATALLNASLDHSTTLASVASLAVPALADWCIVYMLEDDGAISRLAMAHVDPSRDALAREIRDIPMDPRADRGVPKVLRTGDPELRPDATAALLAADVREPGRLQPLLEPLGITSWMCVPMSARGRTFGAISFVSTDSGRRYGAADLALAVDLAGRAALAVDNARLFGEQQVRERRQHAQLATVRVLAEATSLPEAAPRILRAVCESLDWEVGALWIVDRPTDRLRCAEIWPGPGVAADEFEAATRTTRYPPGLGLPGRIWESGEPAWIEDVLNDSNFPLAPAAAKGGLRGAFGFPLKSAGRVIGVLEFFSRDIREPDPDLLAMMASVGGQIGQFIASKQAEEDVRFQKALLESQNEATIDGILVVSPEGTMISFNQRFIDMWGIPDAVADSRSDQAALRFVLDKLADPAEFRARVEYLYEHPEERSRDELRLRDGRVFDRWSAPLIGEDGTIYGRAWYFRDVTELKRAEEILLESTQRAELLAEASALFTASLNFSVVMRGLADLMSRTVGDLCIVDAFEDDGSVTRVAAAHRDPGRGELVEELKRFDASGTTGGSILEAVREGRSFLFEETSEDTLRGSAHSEEHIEVLRALGPVSAIVVPLVARGRTLGSILLASTTPGRTFDREDLSFVEDLARRAALAADNAQLYGERAYVARTLQESLLPPNLPHIPGVELAARFQAVGRGIEVGGDFYDLFRTGTNSWAIVIGDVCGKGVEAAKLTALARYTMRGAAMQAQKPSRVLALLNQAMLEQNTNGQFCTASYLRLRIREDEIRATLACGGHPMPLKVTAEGAVETFGRKGTLLGVFPDPEITDYTANLMPGDTLVLYTDGVTEARGPGGVFGEERLRSLLSECAGMSPAALAERVEHEVLRFQEDDPGDDIALLVVRVPR